MTLISLISILDDFDFWYLERLWKMLQHNSFENNRFLYRFNSTIDEKIDSDCVSQITGRVYFLKIFCGYLLLIWLNDTSNETFTKKSHIREYEKSTCLIDTKCTFICRKKGTEIKDARQNIQQFIETVL